MRRGLIVQISKFRLAVAGVITAASFSVFGAGAAYAVQAAHDQCEEIT